MAREKETELDRLRQQQADIAKRIREAEAKERKKAEADEDRRRYLVGAAVLSRLSTEPDSPLAVALKNLLDQTVRSAKDRALFDLPPLGKEITEAPPEAAPNASLSGSHNAPAVEADYGEPPP
jgi:septal ring factor EnvC (AmiA/AmiB activator)